MMEPYNRRVLGERFSQLCQRESPLPPFGVEVVEIVSSGRGFAKTVLGRALVDECLDCRRVKSWPRQDRRSFALDECSVDLELLARAFMIYADVLTTVRENRGSLRVTKQDVLEKNRSRS